MDIQDIKLHRIIAFDGLDCTGKSTIINRIAREIIARWIYSLCFSFPSTTDIIPALHLSYEYLPTYPKQCLSLFLIYR